MTFLFLDPLVCKQSKWYNKLVFDYCTRRKQGGKMKKSVTLHRGDGFSITASLKNNNELYVLYDDHGGPFSTYEHHVSLTEEATQKLCEIYNCPLDKLLNRIKKNFNGPEADTQLQEFCKEQNLKYDAFVWMDD